MRVPVKWIKDFVDIDLSIKELADALTMTGTKAETVEEVGKNIENVVVGKIEKIIPHPDADKLVITKINIGKDELIQIVTGASNISEGDIIPVALDNSTLPINEEPYFRKIKSGELRGEESNGMLCSASELGIDEKFVSEKSKNGIWILDGEFTLGEDIRHALNLEDFIIEFEITSNRPDCLCMIGIAREVSATTQKPISLPENTYNEIDGKISLDVKVEDKNLCARYMLRYIDEVKICESPYFIKRRLIEAGLRPINNIVDLTNYVMLEYGQPMHAFDGNYFKKEKVVIKTAKDGEKFTTLDEVERNLNSSMLMITDGEENLAIAGVMGGINSEIRNTTTSIVLESAIFDSESIRLTSKTLGLRTDASSRFEKGIDLQRPEKAMNRACHLIEKYGWGRVTNWKVDTSEKNQERTPIKISHSYINKAIGNEISADEIKDIFTRLFFEVEYDGENFELTPPDYRLDINIKADIIEEVARIYGFDKINPVNMISSVTFAQKTRDKKFEENSKDALTTQGFTEIITYSFIGEKDLSNIGFSDERAVRILNPLGEDTAIMRTTLFPTMLNVISRNHNRKNSFFSAFEIGNIFFSKDDKNEEPEQRKEIIAATYGKDEDFFSLKLKLESYFSVIKLEGAEYTPANLGEVFHPARCAKISKNNVEFGYIGQISPIILDKYDVDKEVYAFVLDFEKVMNVSNPEIIYTPISKFPSIKRDISFLVDKKITVAEIEKVMKEKGSDIIKQIQLFDVYEGKNIEEGKKSVSYSIIYQSKERTLKEEEIVEVHDNILNNLNEKLSANLRDK